MANYNLNQFRNTYILNDQSGSLFDSGGPTGSYASGENYYVLIAPQNATGTLTLNVVSGVIDANDALRIYDGIPSTSSYAGLTTNSSLIAVLSGTLSAQTITASSGRAYIRWSGRTNSTTLGTSAGYQIDWTGSGIQTVDSSSGVVRNQYAATFPKESYLTFAPGMLTGSTTLAASKDILLGMWARYDYDDTTANTRGLLTIGDTAAGNQGISVTKFSSTTDWDLRLLVRDSNANLHTLTAANMLLGGGASNTTTNPPQWHHYGWAIRRLSSTGSFVVAYRDGVAFASGSTTFATAIGAISSSLTTVVSQYRTGGVISAGQSFTGSLDDIFLATVDTGSTLPTYHSFFASMYNSGSWVDPTVQITSSFSGKNGAVIFNWRFEETASMLSTKDWGSFGNIHSASTMVTGGGNVFLTATGSGMSYTPYASLAYSASALSNAVISFNTSSASVYENTASYVFSVQVQTASVGQSATASLSTGSFDQTAVLGTNYRLISADTTISSSAQLPFTLSWAAGDTTTKYITASIIDNQTYTGTSSSFGITVLTASSTNITLGSPSFFSLNILDYEEGYPSFTSASYSFGELSVGTASVYVDRVSGSSGPLSISYTTVDNTAKSGSNYVKTTGTLSWADGNSTPQVINVPFIYDGLYTGDLNFNINLFGLSTGSYSSYPSAITSSTITITDQEPGTFNWETTPLSTYESASTITVNVLRTSGSYGSVTGSLFYSSSLGTFPFATGSAGFAYFSSSQTVAQVTLPYGDDLIDEPDDIVYITFQSFTTTAGTAKTGSQGTLALTIIDYETGSVSFTTASDSVYENTSSYSIGLQRLYGGDQAETASITFAGSAVLDTDYRVIYNGSYQTNPFNVTWEDQDKATKYITASIIDNQVSNATKNIIFGIASSSISAVGPTSSFQLNILDYEEGIPSFTSSSYSTGESSGSVTLTVNRVSGSNGPLTVKYVTNDDTAVAATNYSPTMGTLTWADGNTDSKTISVGILYDSVQTSDLSFKVLFYDLSTGSFSNYPSTISSSIITIVDQEPGKFKFSSSSYSTLEGASVLVGVERYSGSFGTVTMTVTSSNATAVSGTDYTSVNQALTFSNAETSRTFTVYTVDNANDVTGPLYFNLGFNSISASYGTSSAGSPATASIYITDNESGSVRFVTASYTGSQNSTITISVERYNGADFAATASVYVSASSTAVSGVDYTNVFPYSLTWADQESGTKTFDISLLAPWNSSRVLDLYLSGLTNIVSGTIMSSSILIQSNVLTQSSKQYSDYGTDFTINKYLNLSNDYTRRTEQVPFSLGTNPLSRLQQAYSSST